MAPVLLDRAFARFITAGRLEIHYPDGDRRVHVGRDGPQAAMRIADGATVRALLLNPALKVGEAYMAGTLQPVGCTLYDLLHVLMLNVMASAPAGERVLAPLRHMGRRWLHYNTRRRARRNVAHHYDLDSRLYRHFLDEDMQYSCGYFPTGTETLAQAQAAKKHHLAAKLHLVRPGLGVLDVGCGWGGMALTLARDYGAVVTGITLSHEQLLVARRRAREAGLEHRVRFELMDYRAVAPRQYDRIISIGMFEHVGVAHYPTFFAAMREALRPDGVMVLHSIGRVEGPGVTNPWIARHIFPGGYSPAVSEAVAAVEKAGLWLTDCEIWRLHYARTIAHWRSRFASQRVPVARLYGERFCRMFEFYLVVSELAFRVQGHLNFQLQLTRDIGAVPLARDYMLGRHAPAAPSAMAGPWESPRYAAALRI
ncbi:SAM-dependent methyltransferase [Komagataeibacter rhaeticus]|uniref:Class I SAM-dependent methyltransferase n=1 Tax=Komagataeibacter rhaeticus TaxID=215221 RepID=A0A181CCB9_9PROT|nr:cyclopropane-fatty-acyl-phospholipid synthase family protein [Komagataeibacter rhaeticus]ATU71975.1 class I SAM-dependent methyltransferase [Komagataeibacter xylinus]EGG75384.1 Cyclopropane-fatty-acyl-phospholipid synthase [Gluconacetobacter sp. SXCC-1]KDU95732.1 cyclopropane-fatty-acyl-phospholipid synthase [Komagataeibacter rhaeticus AF1]MBL7239387.1 class I SAM-dependent methyltransferase [Komagataeibacter rhaeticus]PYD54603.1 SAM-dependent methyltransferase [Komagataeibacter rhaeticus]